MGNSIIEIVRSVVGKEQKIFNDRLKSGARSIKIGLWPTRGQAVKVKAALERAGYRADITVSNGGNFRLHVEEGPQAQLDLRVSQLPQTLKSLS